MKPDHDPDHENRRINMTRDPVDPRARVELPKYVPPPIDEWKSIWEGIGHLVQVLCAIAVPLISIYFLVRFVKWAWYR